MGKNSSISLIFVWGGRILVTSDRNANKFTLQWEKFGLRLRHVKNLVGQFHNSMCCVKKKGPPTPVPLAEKKKTGKAIYFLKQPFRVMNPLENEVTRVILAAILTKKKSRQNPFYF